MNFEQKNLFTIASKYSRKNDYQKQFKILK